MKRGEKVKIMILVDGKKPPDQVLKFKRMLLVLTYGFRFITRRDPRAGHERRTGDSCTFLSNTFSVSLPLGPRLPTLWMLTVHEVPLPLVGQVSDWIQGKKCDCHSTLQCDNEGHFALPAWELRVPTTSRFSVRDMHFQPQVRLQAQGGTQRPSQQSLWHRVGHVPAILCSWPGLLMACQAACLLTCISGPICVGLMNGLSFFP